MFTGFPEHWTTLKKLMFAVGSGIAGASYIWKTITGALIHITDALASPMQKCEVTLEPIQEGTGDPSPTNVRPITGWTGCEVTRTGKNLFDQSVTPTLMDCYGDNGNITNRRAYKIELPSGTYTLSATKKPSISTGAYIYLNIFNADGSFAGFTYFIAGSNTEVSTTKTLTNGQYFILYDAQATASTSPNKFEYFNFQIEKGSTASDYEPYSGTTLSVTFPDSAGTVYGGTVDLVSGVLTVDRAKWNFPTDKNWSIDGNAVQQSFAYLGLSGVKEVPATTQNRTLVRTSWCKTNALKPSEIGWTPTKTSTKPQFVISYDNFIMLNIGVTPPTSAQVNQFIADNGLYLMYPLATPIEIQLTPQEISTLKGVNNVWSNSNGETTITYKAQSS